MFCIAKCSPHTTTFLNGCIKACDNNKISGENNLKMQFKLANLFIYINFVIVFETVEHNFVIFIHFALVSSKA